MVWYKAEISLKMLYNFLGYDFFWKKCSPFFILGSMASKEFYIKYIPPLKHLRAKQWIVIA